MAKKDMKEGSPEEEASESPEKEKGEQDGVHVPEEFQKQTYALMEECDNEECCEYVRGCVRKREEELRKDEEGDEPKEFSTVGMPY